MGAGPGAHGRLTYGGVRHATEAARRPSDYVAQVAAAGVGFAAAEDLSAQSVAQERLLSGLRISDGVEFAEVAALGLGPLHPEVSDLVTAGLLTPDPHRLRATAAGRLVLNWLTGRLAS